MRAVVIGGVVAVLVVGAFLIGANGGFDDPAGPAEELGQAIDEGVNDAGRAIEDAAD